ncbi:hypothetical protein F383_02261 [Gossypium arboreum]|uniref:Yippee domain-containing protein n=1 Tax=Gossypium arboreum TaxID=29729 RepID=A0A0B0PKR0_GOSAR|nr:hypothetical protein F383_02261 [Gossypium arboreum]
MGRIFVVELDGRSYRCKFCRTHLALPDDLVSRLYSMLTTSFEFSPFVQSFHCRQGKAYLFNNALVRSFASDRGRIVDEIDFSSEVYIDTRPSMSDGEDA